MTLTLLPALWFDALETISTVGIFLANQSPEDGDSDVGSDADVVLEILSTDSAIVDTANTQVYIEDVLAYDGSAGGFQTGYQGPNSIIELLAIQVALADGDMEAGPGSELITDGDMEVIGVGKWPEYQSVATKVSGSPGGSGSQVLRVSYDGANAVGAVTQASLTDKATHRLTGWARGDGTAIPEISDGPNTPWVGTSSTVWQAIDITWVAGSGTIYLFSQNLGSGLHVEFDDISVVELCPDWEPENEPKLTKETTTPHGGSQCLRIAYDSVANPQARQSVLPIGSPVRVQGWARGDGGSASPKVLVGTSSWVGTSSTNWQAFDVLFGPTVSADILFQATTAGAGYCEFDDVTVEVPGVGVRITVDHETDWISEQAVDVRVVSETVGGGYTLDESYSFTVEDLVAPHLLSAFASFATTIRATFDEGMLASSAAGTNDALNPANYSITYVQANNRQAAVSVVVTAVTQVSATVYDLTTDIELTFWRAYLLTCGDIADDSSNANLLDADYRTAGFNSWTPPEWPENRRFLLWDMLAQEHRNEDTSGDLERLIDCWQDTVWMMLWDADRITETWDIDRAQEVFLDAKLQELGNPHSFSLTPLQKRKLLDVLVPSYRQHGTENAIVNLVRFFLGLAVTIYAYNSFDYRWVLGEDTLGETTYLGPGDGEPALYTFVIQSLVDLTADQRTWIGLIADATKVAHEHYIIQDPTDATTWDHWELGYSRLALETILH